MLYEVITTIQRVVWEKGEQGVVKAIADMENNLPFPIKGFDCDNGSEFLNWHLHKYFTKRKRPVQFTRSSRITSYNVCYTKLLRF